MAYAAKNFHQGLGALVRGVEEGHQARLNDDGSISVKSDSDPTKTYTVQFWGIGAGNQILFQCDCPAGRHQRFCKHCTRAARRLEREGLAKRVLVHWYVTPKAESIMSELAAQHGLDPQVKANVERLLKPPADPFEGV